MPAPTSLARAGNAAVETTHEPMPGGETILLAEDQDVMRTLAFPRAGDYYGTRGGGIGQAVPGAIGVKIAHPDRPVLAISGDGSALYTIQALWTSAPTRFSSHA